MTRVPVAEGIFTSPDEEPRLIGSRCAACAMVTFPAQDSCPRCSSTEMEQQSLAQRGRLWAWTTQDFQPPSPPYTTAGARPLTRRRRASFFPRVSRGSAAMVISFLI